MHIVEHDETNVHNEFASDDGPLGGELGSTDDPWSAIDDTFGLDDLLELL